MSKVDEQALLKRRAQIDAQLQQMRARDAERNRKRLSRQKTILGGWLLATEAHRIPEIVASLKRAQDRSAFNEPASGAAPPALGAEDTHQEEKPGHGG